jgi:hypothetical protein
VIFLHSYLVGIVSLRRSRECSLETFYQLNRLVCISIVNAGQAQGGGTHVAHDGCSDTVVGAPAVGTPEELEEADTFAEGDAAAEDALDALPDGREPRRLSE